jgi:endonuclease-3
MATQSKAQYLADIQALLKKRYKPSPAPPKLSVFESVVYGICHEDATRTQADAAMEAFRKGFFDWNEVRVSPITEIQGVFERLRIPDAEERAGRLRRFLRQLFEKVYGFNLDALTKKPFKDATKSLQEFEALHRDFVLATVIRLGLGGHAIGIDRPTRRALARLGVAEPKQDDATLRAALERAVPKTKGNEFVDLIEDLAHDTCVEGEPDCPRCELRKPCPTSKTRKAEPAAKAGVKASASAATHPTGSNSSSKAKSGPAAKSAAKPAPKSPPAPKVVAKPAKPAISAKAPAKSAAKPAPAKAKVVAKSSRAVPAPVKAGKGKAGRAK